MVKKITLTTLSVLGIGILLFLITYNLSSFEYTTQRLLSITDISNLKNIFQIYNETSTTIFDACSGDSIT